jgi:ATP-binding cassette, subfamily B, bacterial
VSARSLVTPITESGLRCRSAISGRERWEVPAIKGKPYLAQCLEAALLRDRRVREVRANPVSGRVLVRYDPAPPKLRLAVMIREALAEAARQVNTSGYQRGSAKPLYEILQASLPEGKEIGWAVFFSSLSFTAHFIEGLFVVSQIRTRGRISLGGEAAKPEAERKPPMPLAGVAGISAVLNSIDAWLRYERARRWQRIGHATQQRLRARLTTHIESQDLAFFDRHSTGRLMALVLQDTARIGEFVEHGFETGLDRLLTATVSGILLVTASPRLAALAAIPLILLLAPASYFSRKASAAHARRSEMTGRFSEVLENSLAGIVDVKSFTAEETEERRLQMLDREASDAAQAASRLWAAQYGIDRGVYSVGMSLIAAYGGDLLVQGKLTQQQYIRVVYMFPRLLDAIDGLSEVVRLYRAAKNSGEVLTDVLEARPAICSGPVRLPRSESRGEVIFENVSFGYRPGVTVLHDISFELRPGETLGIVGRTGSGKSTLLRLIMRFYEVDEGRILIDGRDVRDLDLEDLRSSVGLVSQEVYLFQGTVRDNVLYGHPGASDEEVIRALREAGGEELLETLAGGLDADVGERGRKLSGGERQRVAIARVLLKRAPILALDEVTSHLDYETEAAVQRSVRRVNADRSLITVAHRLSTIRDSSKILVLDKGKIHEAGKHEELIEQGGIYCSLWRLQTGETRA